MDVNPTSARLQVRDHDLKNLLDLLCFHLPELLDLFMLGLNPRKNEQFET